MSNHDLGNNFTNLSDTEIETLYEIVLLAGEKPGPAFGPGLFAAYDEVAAREGTTSSESSKYFTFVCRMLWGRKQNETVMDRFVSLLAEAGIQVTPEYEENTEHSQKEAAQGSFSTISERLESRDRHYGVLSSAETLAGEDDVPRSPNEIGFGDETGKTGAIKKTHEREHRRSQSQDTNMRAAGIDRGRLRARLASEQSGRSRLQRAGSMSSIRSLNIQRPRVHSFGTGDAYSADESDTSDATRSRRHSVSAAPVAVSATRPGDARHFLPPELLRRSDEELEAISETFRETKDILLQKRIFSRWIVGTGQAKAGYDQLETLAGNVDRHKLLRDSFLIWRLRLDDRRLDQAWKDNENFYTRMEEAATREREVNLKWIAFSHWKQSAKDEKQKTSVARRHILRRRYFNAWSNITAINDLKVRRFMLRRLFALWQQRSQQTRAQFEQAVAKYESDVVRRSYSSWFFNFLERTAPGWHDRNLEREYFPKWRNATRQIAQRNQAAEESYQLSLQKRMISCWRARAQPLHNLDSLAANFRNHKLLIHCVSTWKREAVLAPRAAQLLEKVERRTQSTAFHAWQKHTAFERQAAEVYHQRTLRNAFTAWNDRMRTNFLRVQVDIRLKSDQMYKWKLATRIAEATRARNTTILSHALHAWLSKAQHRHRSIEGAEHTFKISQQQRTLRAALTKLNLAWQERRALETRAQEYREARLLNTTLTKWQQKFADIELLHRKARAASFYVLTTKALKTWSRSAEEHRKNRKREAYGQIRRLCKMNLAREMLRRMQIQSAHIRNMDRHAVDFQEDYVVKSTATRFRYWKQSAVTRIVQNQEAWELYGRKLLTAAWKRCLDRKEQLRKMAFQARELADSSASIEAMNCLRKMDRRLFQIRGQDHWAVALREKHREKHVKNMLRFWHDGTVVARRPREEQEDRPPTTVSAFRASTTSGPQIGDLSVFDTTAWNLGPLDLNLNTFPDTEQGELDVTFADAEGLITSTPLPGYLRTPSKRNTARAKARQRLAANAPAATTMRTIRFADQVPASAPPRQQTASAPAVLASPRAHSITPFERKLRDQGYTSPSRFGSRMTGNPSGLSRAGALFGSSDTARSYAGIGTGMSGFAGFEDIPEMTEDRSQDV